MMTGLEHINNCDHFFYPEKLEKSHEIIDRIVEATLRKAA